MDIWKSWQTLSFVHSYTLRVVGNGIKAQSTNPEVKVKGADPVINQIIDKLKHINQVSLSRIFTVYVSNSPSAVSLYFHPLFCQTYGNCLLRQSANSLCFFVLWNIKYLVLALGSFFKVRRIGCLEKLLAKLKPPTLRLWITQQNRLFFIIFHITSKYRLIESWSQMQNHLLAMKKQKSIITHLETHLIWFVCLHIYKILFFFLFV